MQYHVSSIGEDRILFYEFNGQWYVTSARGLQLEASDTLDFEPVCERRTTIPDGIFNIIGDQPSRSYGQNGSQFNAKVCHQATLKLPENVIRRIKEELGILA